VRVDTAKGSLQQKEAARKLGWGGPGLTHSARLASLPSYSARCPSCQPAARTINRAKNVVC
jgi:hypothetical protein